MATHSSVLAWRIPGTGEPDGLLSVGPHRVGHDWSDLAEVAAAVFQKSNVYSTVTSPLFLSLSLSVSLSLTHTHTHNLFNLKFRLQLRLNYHLQLLLMQTQGKLNVCPQGQPLHLIQWSDLKLGEVSRVKQRFVAVEYKYSPLCRKHSKCLPLEAPVNESPLLEGFGCWPSRAAKTEKGPELNIYRWVNANNDH